MAQALPAGWLFIRWQPEPGRGLVTCVACGPCLCLALPPQSTEMGRDVTGPCPGPRTKKPVVSPLVWWAEPGKEEDRC